MSSTKITGNGKIFVRISNNEAWKVIQEMAKKVDEIHENFLIQQEEIKGIKVAVKWIYGILAVVVTAILMKEFGG